ncbi:MAG: efflux RND transporter periplasmic adaptor subunit [Deltaproteobacteria bacterium]|nr:efflux RND transporter periplasmic adaptor subunit [Deltaproteobacteria bacterium]
MKKIICFIVLVGIAAGSFMAGSWYTRPTNPGPAPAPLASADDAGAAMPGGVKVNPEKQQMIGVRVEEAQRKGTTHTLRTFGRVAVDENQVYRLIAPAEGWIIDLQGGATGTLVAKDQVLSSFYNVELTSSQQSFFFALTTLERYKASNVSEAQMNTAQLQLRAAENGLKALGMGEAQIRELEKARKPAPGIEFRSPVAGVVLSRNIFPNQRLERNVELYRIADLSRVWILADVYEYEADYFQPDQLVRVTLSHGKKTYQARISRAVPLFNTATQTLKVRLEVKNPGYALKPDMLVDVEFPVQLPPAITVPVDAVLDTGSKQTVFVEQGRGYFEPRQVETGWRLGDRIEIKKGLSAGERVVVSGAFLLDSESRMELAAAGMSGGFSKDPVCGPEVSIRKAEKVGRKSVYRGKTYYFSSDECRERFLKNPESYLQ